MRIVVPTYDQCSAWLIPIFMHFYKKNWPDSPYPIDVLTETQELEGVNTFCAGEIPWSDMWIKYLESIDDEQVLLLLDDFILDKPVRTDVVQQAERFCNSDVGMVHLYYRPKVDCFYFESGFADFKEFPLFHPNSCSTAPAIWQRKHFLNILRSGENPWRFEINGSKRVPLLMKRVMSTKIPAISFCPGGYMHRGEVYQPTAKWVKENW